MYRVLRTAMVRACALAFVIPLAACGGGGSTAATGGNGPATSASTTVTTVSLSGPKVDAAVADQPYQYVPEIVAAGDATLAFTIDNKPAWASFDAADGTLSGTPTGADVGATSTVRITAAIGGNRSTVEFQLKVVATADGRASVELGAPATRTDGTALANLAGYRIYYGKSARRLHQFVDVRGGAVTSVDVPQLTPGTWYFATTAYDSNGFESEPTELATKTIG